MNTASTRRTAIVTGAAGGMGLAISRRLAADGLEVLMLDRTDAVRERAADIDGATGCVVDVAQDASIAAFRDHFLTPSRQLAVLVNNAGINPTNGGRFLLEDTPLEDWDRTFAVNLRGVFLLCREVLPRMKQAGWGRIVNIASRAGRTAVRSSGVHYAASKGGLISLTRMIALQSAKSGVTANCIAPGLVRTPMTVMPPEIEAKMVKTIPVGRPGTVEEIAALASFLCSEEAGYITGTVIDANGGSFMAG